MGLPWILLEVCVLVIGLCYVLLCTLLHKVEFPDNFTILLLFVQWWGICVVAEDFGSYYWRPSILCVWDKVYMIDDEFYNLRLGELF